MMADADIGTASKGRLKYSSAWFLQANHVYANLCRIGPNGWKKQRPKETEGKESQ